MAHSTVELEIADGAATITLNRPDSLNSWNEELGNDLTAALARPAATTPCGR